MAKRLMKCKENVTDFPAYQEFAAIMLTDVDFRVLSLEERGFLSTVRFELWINKKLPSDPIKLAGLLQHIPPLNPEDVERLLPKINPFIEYKDDSFFSPVLEDYREKQIAERAGKSKGGSSYKPSEARGSKLPSKLPSKLVSKKKDTYQDTCNRQSNSNNSKEESSSKESNSKESNSDADVKEGKFIPRDSIEKKNGSEQEDKNKKRTVVKIPVVENQVGIGK